MSKATDSEPASEVEHLIADLSASGPLVFVFGDGAAKWTMHVRVDQITRVRFVRAPWGDGPELLSLEFLGPSRDTVLYCYVGDLYDGQRMRPEKLAAWRALRERYGNRDESGVDGGRLLPPAA